MKRCVESVRALKPTSAVICDTGSTDGTVGLNRALLKQTLGFFTDNGVVLSHKWERFGHNRTIALEACIKKVYYGGMVWAFMINADDTVEVTDYDRLVDTLYTITEDAVNVDIISDSVCFSRPHLFRVV